MPQDTDDPEGLLYKDDFVSAGEERALLDVLGALDFRAVTMRGQTARRTVRHFGLDYDYERGGLVETDPLPDALEWLRERCAALIEREPADLVQILVSRYPAGPGIGWHRDAPAFGEPIVGVSLGAACELRFQRRVGGTRQVHALVLERRSAYSLAGPARWQWEHHIASTPGVRYSVTFRPQR